MIRIFLFAIVVISIRAYGQTPSYETVLTFYHENVNYNPTDGYIELAKKPEGYFVYTNLYTDNWKIERTDYQKIWDASTKKFIKPKKNSNIEYESNDAWFVLRFLHLWFGSRKRVYPLIFYGYPEWVEDTKSYIEQKANPTTIELEALAMAYSEESNAFIHPSNYCSGVKLSNIYEDAGYGKISENRVEGFEKAFEESIKIWKKIRQLDNDYSPNITLNIDFEIGNQYMAGYFRMNCIHELELAEKYLNMATYPPSFVEYAKSILDGCDTNGILLTGGDDNIYILMYVQDKLGYRTDVSVLHTRLVQRAWYLEFLMNRYGLKSSFSPQEIKNNEYLFFAFNPQSKWMDFDDWKKEFQKNNFSLGKEINRSNNKVEVASRWFLNLNSNQIEINRYAYAMAWYVFLYDILVTNPQRKLFTTHISSFDELGIKKYGVNYGHVIRMDDTSQTYEYSEDTNEQLIKVVSAISNDYFKGLGKWHIIPRLSILGKATMMSEEDSEELFSIVEKKVISDLKIENIKPLLAVRIFEFYGKFNKKQQNDFKIKYDNVAINFVQDLVVDFSTLYDDLDELKSLISIYTGMPGHEIDFFTEEQISWNGSSSLLKILKSKIKMIQKVCKNNDLSQSLIKVSSMQETLNSFR